MSEDSKQAGPGESAEPKPPVSGARPAPPKTSSSGASSWIKETLRTWGPAILAVLLIRTFIFEPFRIPSGSMVPTLLIGDHVLVTKFSYGVWVPWTDIELIDLADPARGDVIVFRYPLNPSQNYIKRVVGTPGDRIRVKNGIIYLNGEPQSQRYADRYEFQDKDCTTNEMKRYVEDFSGVEHYTLASVLGGSLRNRPEEEIVVPPRSVFVMGDNRDNSLDSRVWGFVHYNQIKGKAHFVWLSWDGCAGRTGRFRSERMFHSLYDLTGG